MYCSISVSAKYKLSLNDVIPNERKSIKHWHVNWDFVDTVKRAFIKKCSTYIDGIENQTLCALIEGFISQYQTLVTLGPSSSMIITDEQWVSCT